MLPITNSVSLNVVDFHKIRDEKKIKKLSDQIRKTLETGKGYERISLLNPFLEDAFKLAFNMPIFEKKDFVFLAGLKDVGSMISYLPKELVVYILLLKLDNPQTFNEFRNQFRALKNAHSVLTVNEKVSELIKFTK